jgi:CheY-like chemotaxis protein
VLQRVAPSARVDVASDGIEALEAATGTRYDLLLLDVHMPRMDGIEAARRLRATLSPGELPIIVALTADAMGPTRQRCLEAGMAGFVSKPFRVEDVKMVLAMLVGGRN